MEVGLIDAPRYVDRRLMNRKKFFDAFKKKKSLFFLHEYCFYLFSFRSGDRFSFLVFISYFSFVAIISSERQLGEFLTNKPQLLSGFFHFFPRDMCNDTQIVGRSRSINHNGFFSIYVLTYLIINGKK